MLTPRLDQLAAEGIRYTDCYAGGPVCAPSRCSLLTGLHTGHSTVRENPAGDLSKASFTRQDVTFAEVLKEVGYRTACFGKWGFGVEQPNQPSYPNERGFDEFFGYITHNHANDYYPTYLFDNGNRVEYPENAGAEVTYAPELYLQRSLDFIERHRDQPFLLFYNPTLPHSPHDVPSTAPYEDQPWTDGNKAHAAQVTLLDSHVGALVDRLRELGLDDRTLVVFAGDNGPHEEGGRGYDPDFFDANGALRGYKRNLYEGGVRVPGIAWGPGLQGDAAGTVSDAQWSFVDVFRTVADLAGAPVPDHLDGRSVLGAWIGRSVGEAPPMYIYRRDRGKQPHATGTDQGRLNQLCESARDGRWKLIRWSPWWDRYADESLWDVELYDLATDLGETTNVAAAHPKVVGRLLHFIRGSWTERPDQRPTWSPGGLAIDPPRYLVAGTGDRVMVEFTNHATDDACVDLQVSLAAPDGWSARPESGTGFAAVRPGATVRTSWTVVPPAGAEAGHDIAGLTARATYVRRGVAADTSLLGMVTVAPTPPAADAFLSDLPWIYVTNRVGPVERDQSNGEVAAGDGAPISIRGQVYEKGLGLHAEAMIQYRLGGACERFTADVGLDDWSAERGDAGSVAFHVFADDRPVFSTGVLTKADAPVPVDVSVAGADVLTLTVVNSDDIVLDHASWANAKVHVS
jgi:arylsulfatase A